MLISMQLWSAVVFPWGETVEMVPSTGSVGGSGLALKHGLLQLVDGG